MDGSDHMLRRTIITEHLARGLDLAAERRIRDNSVGPDLGEYFLLGDRPSRVSREMHQQVEDLGFDGNALTRVTQFEQRGVELELAEPDHIGSHRFRGKVNAIGLDRPADVLDGLFSE